MKKNIIMFAVVFLVAAALILGTDIQSVEEYYLTHMEDITEDSPVVTISIRCDTVLDNWDKLDKQLRDEKYVPSDGIILDSATYVLRPGDTPLEILRRACKYNQIPMEYQGAEKNKLGTAYVKGIHYLYEFSCGELSGWMFKVNGKFPGVGSGNYELKDKDVVEWVYTCDLGRDVGDTYMEGDTK